MLVIQILGILVILLALVIKVRNLTACFGLYGKEKRNLDILKGICKFMNFNLVLSPGKSLWMSTSRGSNNDFIHCVYLTTVIKSPFYNSPTSLLSELVNTKLLMYLGENGKFTTRENPFFSKTSEEIQILADLNS